MNLVEIVSYHLVETVSILTHGLHLVEICAIICTYTSRLKYVRELMKLTLGIDWADGVCPDRYIHTSTRTWEPHDVL